LRDGPAEVVVGDELNARGIEEMCSSAGLNVCDMGGLDREDAGPRMGRYRLHRATARSRVVKVLYAEDEMGAVSAAAAQAGLRPSSYVAAAALADATGSASPADTGRDRQLLAELVQARLAVRQYGVNLNQIAAALNSGVPQPLAWLERAVAGAERAVARLDEAAGRLSRRLV
jgi:hypothetical protein